MLFTPLTRAIGQLDDPTLIGVLLRSLAWTVACFAALFLAITWGAAHLLPEGGWWDWLARLLGGVGAALLAFWLFLPVAIGIATLFIDSVADAVERRFYPGLPRGVSETLGVQIRDGVVVGARVLAMTSLALLLTLLLPGIGVLLGWAISGWAIGRGLFVAVAMRRMSRAEAQALARGRRLSILALGGTLALAGFVPPLNLLVPVLGVAAMVHLLHDDLHDGKPEQRLSRGL